jgi:uncharacterized ubiquitin-like protein YukD
MLVHIKTLSGRKLSLDLDPKQKLIEVKETLQAKEGIPKEQIRLIYKGKVMNDEMTIEESNVAPGETLMMAIHLKGGF